MPLRKHSRTEQRGCRLEGSDRWLRTSGKIVPNSTRCTGCLCITILPTTARGSTADRCPRCSLLAHLSQSRSGNPSSSENHSSRIAQRVQICKRIAVRENEVGSLAHSYRAPVILLTEKAGWRARCRPEDLVIGQAGK